MDKKLSLLTLAFMTLCACSTPPTPPPPTSADAALGEASYAVSKSIVSLSESAQAQRPGAPLDPPPNPASYGMGGLISVDWSGPVQPLIEQLAHAGGYRLCVLGRAPAIPVLVSVYEKNAMLADVVRDVGYQCGRRATVVVYPDSRLIELRYAKN